LPCAGTTVTFPFAVIAGIFDDTPKRWNDAAKGQDLAIFLDWMIDAGQPVAENMGYMPVPRRLTVQVRKMISQIR